MLSVASALLSRLAPAESISRRDALALVIIALLHLSALVVMTATELDLATKATFLVTWALLNFFWLAVLRRPSISALLSLGMVVALILLSQFKYDKLMMTVNFVDLMIIDPDTSAFLFTIMLAQALGEYEKAGVNVEIVDFKGGSESLKAVIGGSADVVSGYFDHCVNLAAKGQHLQSFVVYDRYPGFALVVSPKHSTEINSIKDLANKKIGVSAPGSSTDFFLKYMGVDIIEAGFPIASDGDFAAVQEIAQRSKKAVICGLSRAAFKDIDRCAEAIKPAKRKRIHTFISTSPVHMLGML